MKIQALASPLIFGSLLLSSTVVGQSLPAFPELPTIDAPADTFCGYLLFFFGGQTEGDGFTCECLEEGDEDITLECTRAEPKCDETNFVNDLICHTDTVKITGTRGTIVSTGESTIRVEACADYNIVDFAPDFLFEREFCSFYSITLSTDDGVSLGQECGVNWNPIFGRTTQVCDCSLCSDDNVPFGFALGFDCNVELAFFFEFERCVSITSLNPLLIPTLVTVTEDPDATSSPSPASTDPDPTTEPVAPTDPMIMETVPPTTSPVTDVPPTTSPVTDVPATDPTMTTPEPTMMDPKGNETTTEAPTMPATDPKGFDSITSGGITYLRFGTIAATVALGMASFFF